MLNKIITALKWRLLLPLELLKWQKSGKKGIAPHYVKQKAVIKYRKKHHCKVFVETGTFMGDMINAVKQKFETIHSIELNPLFATNARQRFSKYPHIKIWDGDSGEKIIEVLNEINDNILFWLDGHCCIHEDKITSRALEDSPILQEIQHVIVHMQQRKLRHVILIDDARLFVGKDGYPPLQDFHDLVKSQLAGVKIFVENDMIVIY